MRNLGYQECVQNVGGRIRRFYFMPSEFDKCREVVGDIQQRAMQWSLIRWANHQLFPLMDLSPEGIGIGKMAWMPDFL